MTRSHSATVIDLNGASEDSLMPPRSTRHGAYAHPKAAMVALTAATGSSQRESRSRRSDAPALRRHARIAPANASTTIVAPGNSSPSDLAHFAVHPHTLIVS